MAPKDSIANPFYFKPSSRTAIILTAAGKRNTVLEVFWEGYHCSLRFFENQRF
jgi:hypothetical protein